MAAMTSVSRLPSSLMLFCTRLATLDTVGDVRCPVARRTIAPVARAVIFSWAMGCAAPHLRPMVASALPPLIKSRDNPGIEERFIGRSSMRGRQRWLGAAVALLAAASMSSGAHAQAALTGLVSSSEEGAMEGVVVSAKNEGSTITTTVVTDEQGRYSFPAARMEAGKYTISIRAIGYKLEGLKTVEVPTGSTATADLKLGKVKSLVPQLSNAEWLLSLPGADKQKAFLTMCVGCHTLQRVLTSNHDAAEFQQVFLRMARYSPGSTPTNPQPLLPGPRGERPAVTGDAAKAAAEFLASVSLGNSEAIEYPLKTLPRPKGRSTKVLITEYDLPRKGALPHDVIVDKDGQVWYSDFGAQFVGVMDPKSGTTKDIAIPVVRPEQPKGGLDLEFDPDGNIWLAMMYQAAIAKIDRRTHEVSVFPSRRNGFRPRRRLRWCRRPIRTPTARYGPTIRRITSTIGSIWRPASSRIRVRPRRPPVSRSGPMACPPITRTTSISWSSAAAASAGATPRRSRSPSGRHRARCRARVAAGSTSRAGCGLPNMAATASACSAPRPTPSRSGGCRRLGAHPTTSLPSRTAPRCGPARC